MAHEPDLAAKESLAALLGDLIADAKDLLVRELLLAQLEVRQTVRATARAARASGAGGGASSEAAAGTPAGGGVAGVTRSPS